MEVGVIGVGGHCLTKDTYHLERGVQVLGKDLLDYPKDEPSLFILGCGTTEVPYGQEAPGDCGWPEPH
jgi:hypothetical protein